MQTFQVSIVGFCTSKILCATATSVGTWWASEPTDNVSTWAKYRPSAKPTNVSPPCLRNSSAVIHWTIGVCNKDKDFVNESCQQENVVKYGTDMQKLWTELRKITWSKSALAGFDLLTCGRSSARTDTLYASMAPFGFGGSCHVNFRLIRSNFSLVALITSIVELSTKSFPAEKQTNIIL